MSMAFILGAKHQICFLLLPQHESPWQPIDHFVSSYVCIRDSVRYLHSNLSLCLSSALACKYSMFLSRYHDVNFHHIGFSPLLNIFKLNFFKFFFFYNCCPIIINLGSLTHNLNNMPALTLTLELGRPSENWK